MRRYILLIWLTFTTIGLSADNTADNRRKLIGASSENPIDATWLITNPSFETGDLTGWTMTPSEGSDMGVRDYELTGRDGNYEANLYTWWSGVAIEQTVGNVPAGIYEVSGLVATWEGYTVNFYANDKMVSAAGQGDCTGIRLTTTVVVDGDGELTIKADRTDINWWADDRKDIENTRLGFLKLDDVRLTCKGLYDVSEQTDFNVTALNVDGLPQKILSFIEVNADGPGSDGTKLISQYLAKKNYDFIGVSEDFNYHGSLMTALDDNYDSGTVRATLSLGNLSIPFDTDGLNLIWKTSKTAASNESWTRWTSTTSTDGNQYVKKGFRHYDMTIDGSIVIDVYVLHMDAGDAVDSRQAQWSQLAEAINSADSSRPKLVIGDTNSRWTREDIKTYFFDKLSGFTAKDAWVELRREGIYPTTDMNDLADQTFPSSFGTYEVVDKILYLNPTAENTLQLLPKGYRLEQDYTYSTVDGSDNTAALGDHRPLVVDFSCFRYQEVTTVIGDVNRDGSITIADVTALVNILLGKDSELPYVYDHEAADVNRDASITIADVTALVNILLGKG
ncbi:MAG: dockerin type I repeat-containing protein [Prevotella sp.]|nr:dockerin type I repeat-containing protein [Prevotella sp.]